MSALGGLLNDVFVKITQVTSDVRNNTNQMVQNMMNVEQLTEKSDRIRCTLILTKKKQYFLNKRHRM